jgi:hypothetical protein
MRDFVGDDPGQLRLVLRGIDEAAVNPDGSSGQGKRVDVARVRDVEAIGILRAVGAGGEAAAEPRDVIGNGGLGTCCRTCCWALRPIAISSLTETNCNPPMALVADRASATVKMMVLIMAGLCRSSSVPPHVSPFRNS